MIEKIYISNKNNDLLDTYFALGLMETLYFKMFAMSIPKPHPCTNVRLWWCVSPSDYEKSLNE